jgi:hypothetical protein
MIGPAQGIKSLANLLGMNHLQVNIDFAVAAWNTVASHEVFTVTGLVRALVIYRITGDLAGGAGATIQFGREGDTDAYNVARVVTELDAGEVVSPIAANTPAGVIAFEDFLGDPANLADLILDGLDLGYEIAVNPATGGAIQAHCFWTPISTDGLVAAGAGGAL